MAKKAMYLGCGEGVVRSLLGQTVDGHSVDVFATADVDDAIQELIRTDFEWLVFDRPIDESTVRLMTRTAELTGKVASAVWMKRVHYTSAEGLDRFVDATFDTVEDLRLTVNEGRKAPRGISKAAQHPILSTLKDNDATRVLAHLSGDGTYLWTNAKLTSLIDRSPGEVIGQSIDDLPVPGIGDDDVNALIETVLDSQELHWIGTEGSDPLGMYCLLPIDDRSVLLFSYAAGGGVAFGERYLDQISDIFFIVDFEGTLYYWNDRVTEVTGYSDVELIDTNALTLFPPDVRDYAREKLQSVAVYGEQTIELPLIAKDGDAIPYQFSGSLVRDTDGTPQFVCGIGRDISKRVTMRREIEDAVEKLEESNAELERFASVASHDLREPLRAIRSYLELLERRYVDDLDDDAREFIRFAVDGAERMQSMIENLLEYSRIGASVQRERVDCEVVLAEVKNNLSVSIEESNADIDSEDLPVVVADRTMLVQLFQNLIDNAIQHTDRESPRVVVTAERTNEFWRFAVEDNGPGIPTDQLDDIFEMFSSRNGGKGLGIGLATCRKIVETLGGSIEVESTEDEGSRFFFTLPAAEDRHMQPGRH